MLRSGARSQTLQAGYKAILCANNGLILRGSRIVMPSFIWQATLYDTHEGHQGIVRTKSMVREKVWWPGIVSQVEPMVKPCIPSDSLPVCCRLV